MRLEELLLICKFYPRKSPQTRIKALVKMPFQDWLKNALHGVLGKRLYANDVEVSQEAWSN